MSQIMKAYLAIFLLLMMIFTAGGIFVAFMGVANAQDFYSVLVDELETGNFQPAIIREGFTRAGEHGYDLQIELYQNNGDVATCCSTAEVPEDTSHTALAKVKLGFPVSFGILNLQQQHTLCGFAR